MQSRLLYGFGQKLNLGFGVWGQGSRVWDLGLGVSSAREFGVAGFGFGGGVLWEKGSRFEVVVLLELESGIIYGLLL